MAAVTSVTNVDFDSLNNLEETAYQDGYSQGFDHGALHGTFEGRDLGRSKGFELWEEVGFYQGMAQLWQAALLQAEAAGQTSRKQGKQLQHLAGLLRLISFFPMNNTSIDNANDAAAPPPTIDADDVEMPDEDEATTQEADDAELAKLDMLALLERVRAKYKLTCSILGVSPRLAASASNDTADTDKGDNSVLVAGKLVDPTKLHY